MFVLTLLPQKHIHTRTTKNYSNFGNKKTFRQIHNEFNSITQRNMSIPTYNDKILNALNELNSIQIKNLPSSTSQLKKEMVTIVNNLYVLSIFNQGLGDDLKPTIFGA